MSEWSRRAFETVITETPKSRAISLSRTAIEEFTMPGCEQEVCPRRGGEGDAHRAKKIASIVRAGRHGMPCPYGIIAPNPRWGLLAVMMFAANLRRSPSRDTLSCHEVRIFARRVRGAPRGAERH